MNFNENVDFKYSKEVLRLRHPFHLVDSSPWPILTALSLFSLAFGATFYMHTQSSGLSFFLSLVALFVCLIGWFRDIIIEATFEGHHTKAVQKGLSFGFSLFILSEVMFFVAWFWAFFHVSLSPDIGIASAWPPAGIVPFDPWTVPFLNTIILLTSGAAVTWAHSGLISGDRFATIAGLMFTVFLGAVFSAFQLFEYATASFSISDSVYGSIFYMATGFHGFHVFVGTIFLFVCLVRHLKYHFTETHHFGFEAAALYWHFVDVVWLFLFVSIYWWGS